MAGPPRRVASTVVKRSLVVAGHATSISLEDAFWEALKAIAEERDRSIADLVAEIDDRRETANLSSAVRVFVLQTVLASASLRETQSPGVGTQ